MVLIRENKVKLFDFRIKVLIALSLRNNFFRPFTSKVKKIDLF